MITEPRQRYSLTTFRDHETCRNCGGTGVGNTSTGTALVISKITPFVFAALLSAWTVAYGTCQRRIGERQAAAATAEQPPPPQHTWPADHP